MRSFFGFKETGKMVLLRFNLLNQISSLHHDEIKRATLPEVRDLKQLDICFLSDWSNKIFASSLSVIVAQFIQFMFMKVISKVFVCLATSRSLFFYVWTHIKQWVQFAFYFDIIQLIFTIVQFLSFYIFSYFIMAQPADKKGEGKTT